MRVNLPRLALAGILIASSSCSDPSDPARVVKAKHAYHAPHGGTIVRLGREEYHLEFVRDAAAGKLTAYLLDFEAQDAIRSRAESFDLVATVGAEKRPLTFKAVPNSAAGETNADASRFEAHAEWLKTTPRFDAELSQLKIRNTIFLRVPFNFPKGNERP